MPRWRIPLSDLAYGRSEEKAAIRVLRGRWLSMGPEVEAFEQEFASFVGSEHAVAVASGTAALHLSFLALGLGRGDEIIQPAINFVAAANMTLAAGATPVFADIVGFEEPTLDPDSVRRVMTPRTRAVIAMHYGGYPARMDELESICRERHLYLIEDACHAVGAHYRSRIRLEERMVGALGDIACFSFFSNKNLAVGEGGMVTTSSEDLARRVARLRSHGMTTLTWDRHRGHANSYDVDVHGYNYRLDEMRAAIGRVQLRKLKQNNRRRNELTAAYRRELNGMPGWTFAFGDYSGDSSCHLAVVVAPDRSARDGVVQRLKSAGIQSSLHYPFLPHFTAFRSYRSAGLDRSIAFAERSVTLPLFPAMKESEVEQICALLHSGERVKRGHGR